jgi:MFS family permease
MTSVPAPAPAPAETLDSGMTHREVLEAMSGLLLGMFVAILSSTVVTTALPEIIGDLGGSQSSYTWVVTSTLLALTVSTPIWGKLADLFDRKVLVQTGLVIYVSGSILAGLSETTTWLIACRVLQGLGVGGLTALVQIILSDLVSPRERGRYSGYLGAVFGVGTVAGPLLGGVITNAFGWRWCFYVGVPFAVAAFVVLQRALHLPRRRREASIDYAGALLIGVAVGIAMFGTTVFLSQYMQIAHGSSPTEAGLLSIPMVVGLFLASALIGRVISRTGRYRRYMLAGTLLMTAGLGLVGTMDETTSLVEISAFMFVLGAGLGLVMQNLVLVVQNAIPLQDLGAGSSLIAFFRSLGGAIGVSVLGALLAHHARSSIAEGLAAQGTDPSRLGGTSRVPDVGSLPAPVAHVIEHAYGTGIAETFLVAAPLGLVAFAALLLLREKPLGMKSGIELAREGSAS